MDGCLTRELRVSVSFCRDTGQQAASLETKVRLWVNEARLQLLFCKIASYGRWSPKRVLDPSLRLTSDQKIPIVPQQFRSPHRIRCHRRIPGPVLLPKRDRVVSALIEQKVPRPSQANIECLSTGSSSRRRRQLGEKITDVEGDLLAVLTSLCYHKGESDGVRAVIDAAQVGRCVPRVAEREEQSTVSAPDLEDSGFGGYGDVFECPVDHLLDGVFAKPASHTIRTLFSLFFS